MQIIAVAGETHGETVNTSKKYTLSATACDRKCLCCSALLLLCVCVSNQLGFGHFKVELPIRIQTTVSTNAHKQK